MNTKIIENIPKRMVNNLIYSERVMINKDLNLVFVILNDFSVHEVKNGAIISSYQFIRIGTGTKISTEMLDVKFYRYSNEFVQKFYYLITINGKLFVLEKADKLVMIEQYENVRSCKIVNKSGKAFIQIEIDGEMELIVTNLQKIGGASFNCINIKNPKNVVSVFHKKGVMLKCNLRSQQQNTRKLVASIEKQKILLPALLRSENCDEKVALVKYGDVWQKVHNDKLIVGVPVFNCTYTRLVI